jgi:hypothetical protein
MTDDKDPPTIWLQPWCADCARFDGSDTGRTWCDDKQEPCTECGRDWVAYALSDASSSAVKGEGK